MKRLLAALFVLALVVPVFAREGFGFKKKSVDLVRTIPPVTNAGARRVEVTVENERDENRDDARTLERYVTESILAGGGTLAEGRNPEVTVRVSLDRLDSHESWDTETEYVRQQTGTKQVYNESKKKYESKPVYSSVPVQKTYKTLEASLTGIFEISDRTRDVASGDLDESYKKKFGDYDTSPAPSRVEDDLMKDAALKVAAQIVPTQDRVAVLVPRASFEPLIPLAESGAWDQYLAAVEAMPAKRSPQEEAYRQYAMAIAKEALAYAAEDRNEGLELLRAAKTHYQTAINSNSSESLFREGYTSLLSASNIKPPLTRASESLAKYEKWVGGGTAMASTGPKGGAPAGMRNQTVIDLAKAGLSDENIMLAIDGASAVSFDLTPTGLNALTSAGVSKSVIAHMQKRAKR